VVPHFLKGLATDYCQKLRKCHQKKPKLRWEKGYVFAVSNI